MSRSPAAGYLSPKRQTQFLRALRKHSLNVSAACRAIGLQGTSGAYRERAHNPDFRRRWQEVQDMLLDQLEALIWQDARTDSKARRWVLSRQRPERWGTGRQVKVRKETERYHSLQEIPTAELERILLEKYPELAAQAPERLLSLPEPSPSPDAHTGSD